MACTTILVGKKASFDGSTIVARNEDSGSGVYTPKRFTVVHPHQQANPYQSVQSKVIIPLPENPMRYTAVPDALLTDGIWAACGVNEKNIAMSATETITSNERVLAADPLISLDGDRSNENAGIGEEDMVTLVLPYIQSAKEGVLRLGELLESYGTYEMNGIAFQDLDEIWWMETIGGHHWIAKRVPDDAYVVMSNQFGIDSFDFEDAFGKQEQYLCSKDLKEFIEKNHLDLNQEGASFNPRYAFGSYSDSDKVYNTPRVWIVQRFFNPNYCFEQEKLGLHHPTSPSMPWACIPERKITIQDVKYTLSHHYQGTHYDPYQKNDHPLKGSVRPIGINRNNFLGVTQIRPYVPFELQPIQWMTMGSNVYNALIPFYTNILETPTYLENTTSEITPDNYYWANRLIAALCDPIHNQIIPTVERYQRKIQAKTYHILQLADDKYQEGISIDSEEFCQKVNEEITQIVKEATNNLLETSLYHASNNMKNAFSRSDN